jgi:hypothetical protein
MMPTRRKVARRGELEAADWLDLIAGPVRKERRLELRETWFLHRDELIARRPAGMRPWGWWQYEAGEHAPSDVRAQAVRLAALGELSDDELARIAGAGRTVGGPYWALWEGVAAALGLDPGNRPSSIDEVELESP